MHGHVVPVRRRSVLLQVRQVVDAVMQLPHRGEHIVQVAEPES